MQVRVQTLWKHFLPAWDKVEISLISSDSVRWEKHTDVCELSNSKIICVYSVNTGPVWGDVTSLSQIWTTQIHEELTMQQTCRYDDANVSRCQGNVMITAMEHQNFHSNKTKRKKEDIYANDRRKQWHGNMWAAFRWRPGGFQVEHLHAWTSFQKQVSRCVQSFHKAIFGIISAVMCGGTCSLCPFYGSAYQNILKHSSGPSLVLKGFKYNLGWTHDLHRVTIYSRKWSLKHGKAEYIQLQ